MPYLSELVGFAGAFETLRDLESTSVTVLSGGDIEQTMRRNGVDAPRRAIDDIVAGGILRRFGDEYSLTTLGIRTCLLLEAINGGDLKEVYSRLTRLDTSLRTYELIREGMTETFLRSLHERPSFGRLYLCSPWISLDSGRERALTEAVTSTERRRGTRPEILVITRPQQGTDRTPPETIQPFLRLGATVFLHKRLHTKLYIREPDASGGFTMAIMGSQNLTRSRYVELGVLINSDSQIINQLIAYFLEVTHHCTEVQSGEEL